MSAAAMHVAKTGLNAQQMKMQVIANNLANVNTTGFKRDRVNFESLCTKLVKLQVLKLLMAHRSPHLPAWVQVLKL